MSRRNPEQRRWRIAYALNRLPWLCWADLVSWAMQDTDTNPAVRRSLRECGSRSCRDEGRKHRDRSCYCGKFQSSDAADVADHITGQYGDDDQWRRWRTLVPHIRRNANAETQATKGERS